MRTLLSAALLLLAAPAVRAVPVIGFHLDGAVAPTPTTSDAYVAFIDGAAPGIDPYDAYALAPPAAAYVQLFAVLGPEAGPSAGVQLAINALPPAFGAALDLQLGVLAAANGAYVGTAFTLTWPQLQEIPAAWALVLHDNVTGADTDLRQAPSYSFTHAPGEAAPRFTLRISNGPLTGVPDPGLAALRLDVAPNPAAGAAAVRYSVGSATPVRVTVYDTLGRTVAVLHEGTVGAGWHEAQLQGLTPGAYVVRLDAAGRAVVRRISVLP